jgi:2',3'-cyclic-nucleotide 2'-phosphodiesterase (5'-nucleotidase family)
MARWASLIDLRKTRHPAVLLDAGGFSDPTEGEQARFRNEYFFEGMRLIGYEAAGIGPEEIRLGPTKLFERAEEAGFKLLSANIYEKPGGEPLGSRYEIIRIGGRRTLTGVKGGVRIGVFSVVLPVFIHRIDERMSSFYDIISPEIAALEAVSSLRWEGCDLIVALSYQGWKKSVDLASDVPGIDVVINGHRSHHSAYGEMVGETKVVDTGDKRTSLAEITVEWRDGKPRIRVRESGDEARRLEGRSDLADLEERFQAERRARGIDELEREAAE